MARPCAREEEGEETEAQRRNQEYMTRPLNQDYGFGSGERHARNCFIGNGQNRARMFRKAKPLPVLSENWNKFQNIGLAVLTSQPRGAIADKMLVVRAGSQDDYAMNPLPFFLSCCAGWMNRHEQFVIDRIEAEIRMLKEQLG